MSKWPMVKLGEVAEVLPGVTFKKDASSTAAGEGLLPVYRAGNIEESKLVRKDLLYVPFELVKKYQFVQQDDILMCSSSGSLGMLGKVARIEKKELATFGAFMRGIRPKGKHIDAAFLFCVLSSVPVQRKLQCLGQGANINNLRSRDIEGLEIPLSPLEEQERIAGILEASARQLEKVQTALDSLRQMRSSLIENHCATSEITVNLDSLAEVTGGLSLSGKRAVNPIECEYLRVANIQRNRFLIDDVKTIRCTEKELDRCLVEDGDILMLEANANPYEVGRAAIAETFGRQFVFQNHLFRIRPVGVSSIVLNALLESTFVRAQLLRVVKTTSGLNTMTINQARKLRVPQRDPAKNHRFNTQLELLSSQARNLEEKQDLLQELHQSLAIRAFAGEL